MYKLKVTFTTTQGDEVYKIKTDDLNEIQDAMKSAKYAIDSAISSDGYVFIKKDDDILSVNTKYLVSYRIEMTEKAEEETDK